MYIIKQIYEIDNKIIKVWKNFWDKCDNKSYFNSYYWFENYTNSFRLKKVVIIMGYLNNELQFILPLSINRRTYITIGGKYLDKTAFLYKGNYTQHILELNNFARKNKITIILNECHFCIINHYKIISEKASDNPYIKLNEEIKDVIKPKERRYIENLIKKHPELSFKVFNKRDAQSVINIVFDIEKKSNKVKKNKMLFDIEQAKELFRNLSKTEFCIIGILYFESKPIAHMVGINNCNKKFMAYHMAYDINYKKFQPGKMVIYHLINYLKKQKFELFDFSRGNSILKKHFSNYSTTNYNIYLNPSFTIKMNLLYQRIKIKMKEKIKKILKEIGLWKK